MPGRLLDTRASSLVGYTGSKPRAGDIVPLHVTGAGTTNIPAEASAVVLNVTVTSADTDGYVTVWPCGTTRPDASNLNFVRGQTVPNLTIVGVGVGRSVCFYTLSSVDLIADVSGYFLP